MFSDGAESILAASCLVAQATHVHLEGSMKEVTVFEATDGQLFNTKEECEQHEKALGYQQEIERFLESDLCQYKGGAYPRILRNGITAWEQFKLLPPAEAAEAAPKKRGRPRKHTEAAEVVEPVKKRGRPRKQVDVAE
jgi:hypothetical protein